MDKSVAHEGWRPRHLAMAGAMAIVLLAPTIGMQLSDEVKWTASDFVFAAVLVGVVSGLYELAARSSARWTYRAAALAALMDAFLLIWANGAVGIIGDGGEPVNLMFPGVLAVALVGAFVARFRPKGMAVAMLVAAGAETLATLIALIGGWDMRGAVFSAFFIVPWLLAAALFREAAK